MAELRLIAADGIPEVRAGDDLAALVLAGLTRAGCTPQNGDVIVLAQKIVSKAEGRLQLLAEVLPSDAAQQLARTCDKDPRVMELLLGESRVVLRQRPGVVIVENRNGLVMANAGIDASNLAGAADDEAVLLLPADPDASAAALRATLEAATGARLGVIINDSFGRAWRQGTIGTAIGAAGVPALLDLRGRPDRRGRRLETSELAVADEIAAAASLLMGQADEGRPVVLVRGLPYPLAEGRGADLIRPPAQDMFR